MSSNSEKLARCVLGLLGAALLDDEKGQRAAYLRMHEIDGSEAGSLGIAYAMAAVAGAGLHGTVVTCGQGGATAQEVREDLDVAEALIAAATNGDEDGAQQLWAALDAVQAARAYALVFAIAVAVLRSATASPT